MISRKVKRERVESWIMKNYKNLKIKAIEREIDLPTNTLQRFIQKGTTISDKRITLVYKWILKLLIHCEKDWLFANYSYLNISAVERDIGLSSGALQKYVKYKRELKKDAFKLLMKWQDELLSPLEQWKK